MPGKRGGRKSAESWPGEVSAIEDVAPCRILVFCHCHLGTGQFIRQGALQRRVCRFKTGGILLQGDKDNYRAILVSLQGVTGVPVSVAEKDREFVPVSVGAEVTKGEEGKDAKEKTAENKPTQNSPAEPTKGTVNVSSNPTGADVLVDAEFVGNSPATLNLTPGKHAVTVKMSGYKDWSKEITVQSGSEVELTANLEK